MTLARATATRLHRSTAVAALRSRQRGQDLVEYGLLVAVIAVTVLGAIQIFGGGISSLFTRLLGHFSGLG